MPFDPSTAKPIDAPAGAFDPTTAKLAPEPDSPRWDVVGDISKAGSQAVGALKENFGKAFPSMEERHKANQEGVIPSLGQTASQFGAAAKLPLDALGVVTSPLTGAARATVGSALSYLPGVTKKQADEGVDTALSGLKPKGGAPTTTNPPMPFTKPAARALMDEAPGIRLTPGQQFGGPVKTAEDSLTSLPLTGSALLKGKRTAIEDLNREVYSRALAPIGQKFEGAEVGRAGVKEVNQKLSAAYDAIKPQITWRATPEYQADVTALAREVANLPPALQKQARSVYENVVAHNMEKGGVMDGQTFKDVESDLGVIAANYKSSALASERAFGQAVEGMQEILRNQLERSNPALAKELSAINTGWAVLTRLQTASTNRAGSGGVFTPGDLSAAVKRMDRSVRKGAFARGDALLQDLSDPAQDVITSTVGDSGTAGRRAHMETVPLLAGAAGYPIAKAYLGAGRALNRPLTFPQTPGAPGVPPILPAPDYRNADDAINGRQ